MITELYFLAAIGAVGAYSIHDHIRHREIKGDSCKNDVSKEFEKFIKHCRNKKTARIVFFLPVTKKANEFSFLHGIEIKGNEESIKEAFKTKDFTKIINKDHVDFNYMKSNGFKFESIPYSNRFMINFYND